MVKRLWPWLVWGLFLAAVGFVYEYHLPKLLTWIRVEIEEETAKNTALRILPGNVKLHLFPVGLSVSNIRLAPSANLKKFMLPTAIKTVRVSVDFWQLAQGRIHISEIMIDGLDGTFMIPTAGDGPSPHVRDIMSLPSQVGIPLEKIRIQNSSLRLQFPDEQMWVYLPAFNTELNIAPDVWGAELFMPQITLNKTDKGLEIVGAARGGLRLSPEMFQVVNMYVKKGRSIARIDGEILGEITQQKFSDAKTLRGFANVQALVDTQNFVEWWNSVFTQSALPKTEGLLKLNLRAKQMSTDNVDANAIVETDKLQIDGFYAGNLSAEADLKNKQVTVAKFHLDSRAGPVKLQKAKMDLTGNHPFSAIVDVEKLDLHQLLLDVRAGDIPLIMQGHGQVNCEGAAKPFSLQCAGELQGNGFKLWADDARKSIIVDVPNLSAKGKVSVDLDKVQYDANVAMPTSQGTSQGVITYKDGFNIKYKTDNINFKDIANLGDLKLEGTAAIEGSTAGDSHAATFAMQVKGQNIWFENYFLGQLDTKASYKTGHLYFENGRGQIGTSHYQAQVDVDFPKSRLKISGSSEDVTVADGLNAFSRKFTFPVTASGQGSVKVTAEGPFQFNALTYQFHSAIYRGTVAGESFDKITFNVNSKDGEVRTENVALIKNKSVATMEGEGHPNGNIDVRVHGRNFRLEESEAVSSLESNITGPLDFDMNLKGYVLLPDTVLKINIPQMSLGEESVGSSHANLKITSNTFAGEGQFLNGKLKGEFIFPYKPSSPFKLKAQAHDFDFGSLSPLIVPPAEKSEFKTSLTAAVDLASQNGGFWNSTGNIQLQRIVIRRGSQQMALKQPVQWKMQNGNIDAEKTTFEGDGTLLNVTSNRPAKKKMDLALTGKINLGFAYLLTPFLADLRGTLSTTSQLRADDNGVDLFGSGFLENGVVKIRNLTHPFQNIRADLLFNQKKILANSLAAEFASGQLTGDGQIEIKGRHNIPLRLSGRVVDADLQIPEGFRSKGNGDMELTGSWFPFLLKGNFYVKTGLMTREFTDEKANETQIRPSIYLPQNVSAEQFAPLKLDINLDVGSNYFVKNSMMDATASGRLKVAGTPAQPLLTGDVNFARGGKLLFRGNEFEILTGHVSFIDGQTKDPKLYLSGQTHFDDGSQTFDINLLVLGTGKKPDIRLSSQPPMTQEEIISLLALGVKPEKFEKNFNESRQGAQAGAKLGTALFADNPLKKEIQSKTGFQVDIASATTKAPQVSNRNAAFDDTTGVSVPKIVVSRQWTPKFGASASRTVGESPVSNVQFKYRLNRSFSVIGRWETKESEQAQTPAQSTVDSSSLFGLDLEYKMEFK